MKKQKTWIDISVPIYSGMVHGPSDPAITLERIKKMEEGARCNLSHLSLSAHSGTHMDAPLHFLPKGKSLDILPFEAVIGPARVIEIKNPHKIERRDLQYHRLRAGERILCKTRNSHRCWKTNHFMEDFVAVSPDAAEFLVERKIQTIGIDYLSIGPRGDESVATHQILLRAKIWIIEGLNLAKVLPGQYDMIALPLKLKGAEGAPARVVLRPRTQKLLMRKN